MTETLRAFHRRVDGFQRCSLPQDGPLVTKPLLVEKVGPTGALRPFYGNTMIFDLPEAVQLRIARMQLLLHHACGAMLAEPLAPATLHLTLHDLLNGVDGEALAAPVQRTGEQAKIILADLRAEEAPPLCLTSTLAFNMTCGSVALGFTPDTEEDCARLMAMHARFQAVVPLDYPLTPHVTLAYYRPGIHATAALEAALSAVNALEQVHIRLSPSCLHYARFTDMNTYLRE